MIDLLRSRRSIRQFKDQAVEEEKLKLIEEAGLRSPSSKNGKPWEFVVVNDSSIIAELGKAKPRGIRFLANAPLVIAVAADTTDAQVWIEDASIAATFMQLEAQSLGLGSCWVQIRKRSFDDQKSASAYVREVLNMPENYEVLLLLAIGYPDQEKPLIATEDLNWEKIHYNHFSNE